MKNVLITMQIIMIVVRIVTQIVDNKTVSKFMRNGNCYSHLFFFFLQFNIYYTLEFK